MSPIKIYCESKFDFNEDFIISGKEDADLLYKDGLYFNLLDKENFKIDFTQKDFVKRIKNYNSEPIIKAIGKNKNLKIIDATAGLGRDGFLMAAAGADVTMLEKSKVIYYALKDGLERAKEEFPEIVNRIKLINIDAKCFSYDDYDLIYLDPMFNKKKKSVAKKELEHLKIIASNDSVEELMNWAHRAKKIIVKKPLKYGFDQANHRILGKLCRFDVYIN